MSGEFHPLNRFLSHSALLQIAGILSFLFGTWTAYASGIVIVDYNVYLQFFAMILLAVMLGLMFLVTKPGGFNFTVGALLIIFYSFLLFLSIPYFRISIFFLLSLLIMLKSYLSNYGADKASSLRLIGIGLAILSMILISGLIRFNYVPQGIGLLVASIADDVITGGTPPLFLGGVVFFTRYIVFSVSIQSLAMFSLLSVLLVQNYFLIISYVRMRAKAAIGGQLSGALSALSCQCESITAAFPSIISLVLSIAVIPLILESIILVLLTNYLLRLKFMKGVSVGFFDRIWPVRNKRGFLFWSSLLILAMPLIETYGVYLHLENSLYFFGGINFLMLFTGILISLLISEFFPKFRHFPGKYGVTGLVLISSTLMFMWFYPPLTILASGDGAYFALMSISSFAGGMISGIAYSGLSDNSKKLFLEFLSMMLAMFAIIVFYVSILFSYSIWNNFGLAQQTLFSLIMWIFALPFMWLTTNLVLNSYAKHTEVDSLGTSV